MPKYRIIDYGLVTVASFAVAALAIWRFWPDILERLEQRPYPPTLSEAAESLESGDVYTLKWQAATSGPKPEFYYIEKSTATDFTGALRLHVPHKAGQTPSKQFIAPAVPGSTTFHHRALTGYKSKHYAGAEVLSDPSNVVDVTVKPIADPSVFPITGPLYSGQTYTVSWTTVSKANAYALEEQSPSTTSASKLSATSKTFTAPAITSATGNFCYRVEAAKAIGSSWIAITGWSNQECVQVKRVEPPTDLTVAPQSVESGKSYTVSWSAPASGPKPLSSYEYRLRRKSAGALVELPWQKATTASYQAPKVTTKQTLQFEVMASFASKPITGYSSPVTLTVTPPAPPPPPSISKVVPAIAPAGDTVKIMGKNLAKASLTLYAGTSLSVTPKAQSDKELSFVVPTGASLKTTHVRVSAAGKTAQSAFTVARKAGKFVERQDEVKIVPLTRSCGKFTSKLAITPAGPLNFTGSFKQGSKVLVKFPSPGFKAYSYGAGVLGGLGFSKACKVGAQIGESSASVAPVYINFYALDLGADSSFSAGAKIKGPHSIEPSVYYKKGLKLLFSPDETIVAVINRRKPYSSQYGITIWTLDLLTGNKLPKGPYFYDGTTGTAFNLSIDKMNQFFIERGGVTSAPVVIPKP